MKVLRLIRTLRHLKRVQFYYRIKLILRAKLKMVPKTVAIDPSKAEGLTFSNYPDTSSLVTFRKRTFSALNVQVSFQNKEIDWNYSDHGKLWTYNLNYFEFLHDPELDIEEKKELIESYLCADSSLKDGLEPYPISLRLMNWIRFLSHHKISDHKIDQRIAEHTSILLGKLEYHLLANHLLENAFAVFMSGMYLKSPSTIVIGEDLIRTQLKEQITMDGAHYERSVMYHKIILYRVLEASDLLLNNQPESELINILEETTTQMMGWLLAMNFESGKSPRFNDYADGISLSTSFLREYFSNVFPSHIPLDKKALSASGYRKFTSNDMEVIVNFGEITPKYQPGHAHADTFSFELNYQNREFIVDPGVSTYEANELRGVERSTSLHNTVHIEGKESNEVWGGFRVGRMAKVHIQKDLKDTIIGSHNGFRKDGVVHERQLSMEDQALRIRDNVKNPKGKKILSRIHFHPDWKVYSLEYFSFTISNKLRIETKGVLSSSVKEYQYCVGFNKTKVAQVIELEIEDQSEIIIKKYEN